MKDSVKIFSFFILLCLSVFAAAEKEKVHLLKEGLSEWQDTSGWQVAGNVTSDSENENLCRSVTAWKKLNVKLNSQ